MRITESSLRQMIRSVLAEAPLADLYEPSSFQKAPLSMKLGANNYPSIENTRAEQMKKAVTKPSFKMKLQKLAGNLPLDIYVAPFVAENFVNNFQYDFNLSSGGTTMFGENRAKFGSPQEVKAAIQESSMSDEDKEQFTQTIDRYIANSGGGKKGSCLIIPILRRADSFEFFTPWMIFHALFDRGDSEFVRNVNANTTTMKKNVSGFDRLKSAISAVLYEMKTNLRFTIPEIESLFTMGSARSGWFTKNAPRGEGTPAFNSVLLDLAHEAATQAAVTKEGFRYNEKVWEELARKRPKAVKTLERVKQKLDFAVAESEKVKQGLTKSLSGKVVIFQATRN